MADSFALGLQITQSRGIYHWLFWEAAPFQGGARILSTGGPDPGSPEQLCLICRLPAGTQAAVEDPLRRLDPPGLFSFSCPDYSDSSIKQTIMAELTLFWLNWSLVKIWFEWELMVHSTVIMLYGSLHAVNTGCRRCLRCCRQPGGSYVSHGGRKRQLPSVTDLKCGFTFSLNVY